MLSLSTATRNAALNGTGFKEQFDGGFIFIFAGAAPANADTALNMASTHTRIVKISKDGDDVTGLTFAAPTGGVLSKTGAHSWQGVAAFSGFEAAASSLGGVFYRLCAAGDNGQGAADGTTGYRIQGSVGAASSGADLEVGNIVYTPSAIQIIETFNYTLVGA